MSEIFSRTELIFGGDAMDKLKKMQKASEITEDDLKNGEEEIQKITDGFVKDIDKLASVKEKEVMEI